MTSSTYTQTLENISTNMVLRLVNENYTPPHDITNQNHIAGGRFRHQQIDRIFRNRLEEARNSDNILPRLIQTDSSGRETLDHQNINYFNNHSLENRQNYINDLLEGNNINTLSNHSELHPYIQQYIDSRDGNTTILSILYNNLDNQNLLSYIHYILHNEDAILHIQNYIRPIFNLVGYHALGISNPNEIFNLNLFLNDLNRSFTTLMVAISDQEIRRSINSIQNDLINIINQNMEQNATDLSNVQNGATVEIENIRQNSNNRITANNYINRTNVGIALFTTMAGIGIAYQLGIPISAGIYSVRAITSATNDITPSDMLSETPVNIRLRDIWDAGLIKLFKIFK